MDKQNRSFQKSINTEWQNCHPHHMKRSLAYGRKITSSTWHSESKVMLKASWRWIKRWTRELEFSQWHLILSSGWFQHLLCSLVLMGLKWHIYFWQHIWIYITWCIISIMYPSSLNTSSNSLRISPPFCSGDMLYIHLTISRLPFNLSKHETSFLNISHATEWYQFFHKCAMRILLVASCKT